MSQITKATAQKFRIEAGIVLRKLATEMGLVFEPMGTIRFSANDLRCKIEFKTKSSIPAYSQLHGDLWSSKNRNRLGLSYKVKNTIYTVTRYNGKPKFCLDVVNQRGKRYCVAVNFFDNGKLQDGYKNPFVK
jgi:hypothetical protein